jgi:hypothetical protein
MELVGKNHRTYSANRRKVTQLIGAGFVAITAMTTFSWLCRAIGTGAPDFAAVYGAILNEGVYPLAFSGLWWTGLLWHFINGTIILSLLFDYLSDRLILSQVRWTKGVLWGGILWLVYAAIIQPGAGEGFFATQMIRPISYSMFAIFAWMLYGIVLDGMTRVRMVHGLGLGEREAA